MPIDTTGRPVPPMEEMRPGLLRVALRAAAVWLAAVILVAGWGGLLLWYLYGGGPAPATAVWLWAVLSVSLGTLGAVWYLLATER